MNEQLQKELVAWLAGLREQVGAGLNFVIEQAPLVVREKVALGRAVETTWLLLAVAIALTLFVAGVRFRQVRANRDRTEKSDGLNAYECLTAASYVSFIAFGLACAAACSQAESVYLVWLAPRVYIINWLVSLK